MVELVYQRDSYIRELDAVVTSVVDDRVYVDKTIFHPRSGGVDHDTGYIVFDDRKVRVFKVLFDREKGDVAHFVEDPDGLEPGMRVKLVLDWDRRYRLMRLHTAAHILAAIMYREYGALITGGNISPDKAYDDYSLETMDKEVFVRAVPLATKVVDKDI